MKKMIILVIAFYSAINLFGADLENFVETERAAILLEKGSINELQTKKPSPLLVPNLVDVQNLIQSVQASFDPNVMVESLFLYKKPSNANQNGWTKNERTAIFNYSLALSSLTGLEYYSSSRKKMRTFYENSEIIDNPEMKNPQQDPVFANPPKELILYARQKDLTFGDNVYQYTYYTEDDYLIFVQENLTTMNAGIIPAIGKNKLRSTVAIIDAGEYFLIYVISMADTVVLPGISGRMGRSFSTRAEAVLNWFSGQADKAFQTVSEKD
jgi:hypothetical protein